jgi:hypothetical protein
LRVGSVLDCFRPLIILSKACVIFVHGVQILQRNIEQHYFRKV